MTCNLICDIGVSIDSRNERTNEIFFDMSHFDVIDTNEAIMSSQELLDTSHIEDALMVVVYESKRSKSDL